MATPHRILELRTSRDSEHSVEVAVQFFSTLPQLKDQWYYQLMGEHERISFEIVVQHQTIFFLCSCPERLVPYIQKSLAASYPEIVVTLLEEDPLSQIVSRTSSLGAVQHGEEAQLASTTQEAAVLRLKHQEYLPLKTYKDFTDVDTLAGLLATLSQLQAEDLIVIQLLVTETGDGWKKTGYNLTQQTPPHPQKALIERKLASRGLKTSVRILVNSPDANRSEVLIDTVTAAMQGITQSEGNSLILKKSWLLKKRLINDIAKRRFGPWDNAHFSLEELATIYHLPSKKVAHLPNIAWGKNLLGEPPENLPILNNTMDPLEKREINPFGRVQYKGIPTVYGLKRADRRRHLYVIGKTGTGKSTLLANMAINDLKNNEGLCVIDPHGDLVETLLDYIPSHRINDVVYFDPADTERTVKINLFEGKNVAHRELIASGIVAIFQKLYSYSWGPRLEYILRNALLTLLKSESARLSDILDLLNNPRFREKIVEKLDDPILINFWEHEFNKMQDRARTEAVAPILNKVGQFVSSPLVRDVVNAHKSSFSIEEIMDEGKILLVNLSQGRLGEDNATLLGAMLITKIQLAAMARVNIPEEERKDFYLYVDEFQNFATQSFNKILSEARKYRLNLTLANQYIAQIPEEVQKAIFGNCGSVISFVMGADDASVFAKEYGDKYTSEDLVSLSRYQIVNKITIDNIVSQPFPASTLNLAKNKNSNRAKVVKVSRERYASQKVREQVKTKAQRNEEEYLERVERRESQGKSDQPPQNRDDRPRERRPDQNRDRDRDRDRDRPRDNQPRDNDRDRPRDGERNDRNRNQNRDRDLRPRRQDGPRQPRRDDSSAPQPTTEIAPPVEMNVQLPDQSTPVVNASSNVTSHATPEEQTNT